METRLKPVDVLLIAVLGIFRAMLGYGSVWIDFCLFWIGLIVFQLPTIMHMRWSGGYTGAHMAAGGIIMGLSIVAWIMTVPVNRSFKKS